jgi:hypothetical protein
LRIGITKIASKLTKVGSSAIVPTYLLIALQSFHNKKNTDSSELIKDQILEQQQGTREE